MTRFAWLQCRTQTLFAAALLAALALTAAITGVHLSHLFHSIVAPCQSQCSLANEQFLTHEQFMNHMLDIVARLVPALFGIFWGAPLIAREMEAGTFRLAWTQTVTCSRWIITKLALGALLTVLLAGILTLTITWWYRAVDPLASNRYAIFDRRDIVPIGYALFAFAAGALIGAILRRTVPAMATTLAVFIFARVATQEWIRPHLLSTVTRTMSIASGGHFGIASINGGATAIVAQGQGPSNSWTISSHIITAAGRPANFALRSAFVREHCPSLAQVPAPPTGGSGSSHAVAAPAPGPHSAQLCIEQATHAFRLSVTYLPADRYWTLQWLETGLFVGLALLCSLGSYWWVTHRAE